MTQNKNRKFINDPVYGFITLSGKPVFQIIEHPYFQRLRRITQLGLTHLVYPGAIHTRFHHALGCMHLMKQAIVVLKEKGHTITNDEKESALLAILIHDIGHGPFSHALENTIVDTNHETLSKMFIERLNKQLGGQLEEARAIFDGTHPKRFLHQLVSSQLDVDRLDFLRRDSFFTGVSEGVVGSDRIIKMLEVANNELVVEAKGIYSIEKFIVARRLMYWQVYMHKTVLSAEYLLMNILKRARELAQNGKAPEAPPDLSFFIQNPVNQQSLKEDPKILEAFARIDDFDVMAAIKNWTRSDDRLLKILSEKLIHRRLYKIEMQDRPFPRTRVDSLRKKTQKKYALDEQASSYLVFSGKAQNHAYNPVSDNIRIVFKDNQIKDITEVSDPIKSVGITKMVYKYFLCYPKDVAENCQ